MNEPEQMYEWRFGTAVYDEGMGVLQVGGRKTPCAPRQLALLSALLRAGGNLLSNEQLLDQVWRDIPAGPQALDQARSRLTKALGENRGFIIREARKGLRIDFGRGVSSIPVQRAPDNRPKLKQREPVPHAPDFILLSALAHLRGAAVWLAGTGDGVQRMFKVTLDARLPFLKREVAVCRHLVAQLGARPDLLQVLDCNLERPPYFLASEPDGQALDDWAVEDGRLKKLSVPERLALGVKITEALTAVHEAGVLHAHLTPERIHVIQGAAGLRVRLVGFDIAREREGAAALRDESGMPLPVLGTADIDETSDYVAPEVLEGQPLTTASDVYALGLILYQVLAGDLDKPLWNGWERDVPDALLRADILAATDGDPQFRIGSCAELLGRLRSLPERHRQAAENELARLRTARMREDALSAAHAQSAQQAQRLAVLQAQVRRAALITGVLGLIGLAVVAGGAIWIGRLQAQLSAASVSRIEDGHLREMTAFLEDLLGTADPSAPHGSIHAPAGALLARAEGAVRMRFSGEAQGQGLLILAGIYFGRGAYGKADALQREAIEVLARTRGAGDEETLRARYQRVRSLDLRSLTQDADALLRETDRLAGSRLQRHSALTLLALWVRAAHARGQSHVREAQRWYEDAEAVRVQIAPQDAAWLAQVGEGLAWGQIRTGHSAEALDLLASLGGAAYSADALGLEDWGRLRLQESVALRHLGRYAKSEEMLKDVVSQSRQVAGDASRLTGDALATLADTYEAQGQLSKAIAVSRQALSVLDRGEGLGGLEMRSKLASLEYLSGHTRRALPPLRAARTGLLQSLGDEAPATQLTGYYLAAALCETGHAADAQPVEAKLDPAALAAEDSSGHWSERLAALKGAILIGTGHPSEGQALVTPAITALKARQTAGWLLKRVKRTCPGGRQTPEG